ncbi:MAG: type II toxin-antitoxin system VapC family toxin [Micromonosporaceae bacterium]
MSPNPLVVIDASVLIHALTSFHDSGVRVRAALTGARLAAPEHLLMETFHGIRGLQLGGKLDVDGAQLAVDILGLMPVELVPSALLLPRMWQLRNNLTGYDAAYVAAAERLQVPLITGDRKLAAATGPQCQIMVP